MVNNKQLVLEALSHKAPPRIPYYVDFSINEKALIRSVNLTLS